MAILITPQNIIMSINGTCRTVTRDTPMGDAILKIYKDSSLDADQKNTKYWEVLNPLQHLEEVTQGACTVSDGVVYIDGKPVAGVVANRIQLHIEQGFDFEPLANFVRRLRKNPSHRSRTQLYTWLEAQQHPLLPDGRFLAYKKVRSDYLDCHSGKYDNRPGQILSMDRSEVDDDPNNHCSSGFHVANYKYAHNFGGSILLECAVDPADVVSVPNDYDCAKMRVCKYEVLKQCVMEDTSLFRDYDNDLDENEDENENLDEEDYNY